MDRLLVKTPSSPIPTTHWIRSDSTVVGRRPYCDVVLNNNAVSREHARLTKRDDGVYVEDLRSRNGVWVNGVRIAEPTRVYSRDSIQIGDATLNRLRVINEEGRPAELASESSDRNPGDFRS